MGEKNEHREHVVLDHLKGRHNGINGVTGEVYRDPTCPWCDALTALARAEELDKAVTNERRWRIESHRRPRDKTNDTNLAAAIERVAEAQQNLRAALANEEGERDG